MNHYHRESLKSHKRKHLKSPSRKDKLHTDHSLHKRWVLKVNASSLYTVSTTALKCLTLKQDSMARMRAAILTSPLRFHVTQRHRISIPSITSIQTRLRKTVACTSLLTTSATSYVVAVVVVVVVAAAAVPAVRQAYCTLISIEH